MWGWTNFLHVWERSPSAFPTHVGSPRLGVVSVPGSRERWEEGERGRYRAPLFLCVLCRSGLPLVLLTVASGGLSPAQKIGRASCRGGRWWPAGGAGRVGENRMVGQ